MPTTLDIAAICLVIIALLAYVNHSFIGLPTTIGVMAAALVLGRPARRHLGRAGAVAALG